MLALVGMLLAFFVVPSAAGAAPTATLGLSKQAFASGTNDPLTRPVTPWGTFDYQLAASCSGLTQGCINAKTVDVLPLDIVFSGADSSPLYTVSFDAVTRTVTTTYASALPAPPNPLGSVGLPAGSTRTAILHVTLSPASTAPDDSTITNTATTTADNANPVRDSADVTVSVPRTVTPVATKSINPNSVVAQSGAATTATLSVRNGSSMSADVTSLTVSDTSRNTGTTSTSPRSARSPGSRRAPTRCRSSTAPRLLRARRDSFVAGPFVPGSALSLPAAVDPATFVTNGTQSITDLPIGARCTIGETDTRGATSTRTVYSDGDHATIGALVDATAELTNTYDASELTVTKAVRGPGAAGPYAFTAACTITSNAGTKIDVPLAPADAAFTLSDGQHRTISVLTGAACVVAETNPPRGDTVSDEPVRRFRERAGVVRWRAGVHRRHDPGAHGAGLAVHRRRVRGVAVRPASTDPLTCGQDSGRVAPK